VHRCGTCGEGTCRRRLYGRVTFSFSERIGRRRRKARSVRSARAAAAARAVCAMRSCTGSHTSVDRRRSPGQVSWPARSPCRMRPSCARARASPPSGASA
jgi:hypothetical protein